jgi:hypothetical protein
MRHFMHRMIKEYKRILICHRLSPVEDYVLHGIRSMSFHLQVGLDVFVQGRLEQYSRTQTVFIHQIIHNSRTTQFFSQVVERLDVQKFIQTHEHSNSPRLILTIKSLLLEL